MSWEVISVGIALAGLIVTLHLLLKKDFHRLEDRLEDRFGSLEDRVGNLEMAFSNLVVYLKMKFGDEEILKDMSLRRGKVLTTTLKDQEGDY